MLLHHATCTVFLSNYCKANKMQPLSLIDRHSCFCSFVRFLTDTVEVFRYIHVYMHSAVSYIYRMLIGVISVIINHALSSAPKKAVMGNSLITSVPTFWPQTV